MSLNLHPTFAAALAPFQQPNLLKAVQRAAYIKALKAHDWSFQFADDHGAYERGREQHAQLKLAQRELDADFAIWNEHCPAACRDGRVYA